MLVGVVVGFPSMIDLFRCDDLCLFEAVDQVARLRRLLVLEATHLKFDLVFGLLCQLAHFLLEFF